MYAHQVIEDLEIALNRAKDDLFRQHTSHAIDCISSAPKFHIGTAENLWDILGIKIKCHKMFSSESGTSVRLPYPICWFDFDVRTGIDRQKTDQAIVECPSRGILVREIAPNLLFAWQFHKIGKKSKINNSDISIERINNLTSNSRWLMSIFGYIIHVGDAMLPEDALEKTNARLDKCGLGWMPREAIGIGTEEANVLAIFCTSHGSSSFVSENTYDGVLSDSIIEGIQHEINDLQCLNLALMLLDCKNIGLTDNTPPKKLNISRIKKGKPPMFIYKTLALMPTSKREKSIPRHLWENRVHLCRGNFATYTEDAPLFGKYTGRFWRQPCVKGREDKGAVMKDYRIDPSKFKESALPN